MRLADRPSAGEACFFSGQLLSSPKKEQLVLNWTGFAFQNDGDVGMKRE